jgi:hypothetical protein
MGNHAGITPLKGYENMCKDIESSKKQADAFDQRAAGCYRKELTKTVGVYVQTRPDSIQFENMTTHHADAIIPCGCYYGCRNLHG